jgi:O-antigen/teichoic acid export membrane protein
MRSVGAAPVERLFMMIEKYCAADVLTVNRPSAAIRLKSMLVERALAVVRTLHNPLLRNGYLLTLSAGLTSVVGLLYWTVAAWRYSPAAVGSSSAAISLMTLISAISQLNMSSVMVRFVPAAGAHTRRLIVTAFAVCGGLSVLVGSGVMVAVRTLSDKQEFFESPLAAGMFVVAVTAYGVFVIQDAVLVGLRRTVIVPFENGVFSLLKLALVVGLAGLLPFHGIFASWVLGLIVVNVAVGVYLFRFAIPRHERAHLSGESGSRAEPLPPVAEIRKFVAADYVGAICSIGAVDLMPIAVVAVLGAEQNGYFSIAWIIAYSVHLISANMGTSLVAESAHDPSRLAAGVRSVITHTAKFLVPAVVVMIIGAPVLLSVFGSGYRSAADDLRLLVLAAIPNLLVSIAVSSARAQRRLRFLLTVQASQCATVVALTWLLLHAVGRSGASLAWLTAQCVFAAVLLIRRDLWMPVDSAAAVDGIHAKRTQPCSEVGSLPNVLARVPDSAGWTTLAEVGTRGDVSVVLVGPDEGPPAAVLKIARGPLGAAELRMRRRVLGGLATERGLDEQWYALLPETLAFHDGDDATQAVESYRPGVDMTEELARHPHRFEELVITALRAIAPLHRTTATHVVVDDACLLRRWVVEPLEALTTACYTMDPQLIAGVDRLTPMVRDPLLARRMTVSWTHGDYIPGNVRLAGPAGPVTGILGWGAARPARLALVDEYLMVLTASRHVENVGLGAVVSARLRAGGLTTRERGVLHTAHENVDALHDGVVDERTAILLTWLHHTADQWQRCVYREDRVWWATNVEPVLRELARPADYDPEEVKPLERL